MRRNLLLCLTFLVIIALPSHASPSGPLTKHLSSLLKWTGSSSKTPQPDGNAPQFESGYLVETIVEGNEIGVIPHKIRVSEDGELFAVDSVNNNVVKITPPLSQYSRARLVAGSFKGNKGHIDGKPSDARFNHPKGVTMDDKGNVYVADTLNLAIRKIVDTGVTTIAGGKSNIPGYSDGPGEDAKFSNDFDVIYVRSTCSLLVVDRGNAALRQISLNQEDCDHQYGSVSVSDVAMFVGALLVGYVTYMLQQGFGPSFLSFKVQSQNPDTLMKEPSKGKPTQLVNNIKEEIGWASFRRLITEFFERAIGTLHSSFNSFLPSYFISVNHKKGLTPLKDTLRMPEEETKIPTVSLRENTSTPLSESQRAAFQNAYVKYDEMKPPKMKQSSVKDKHRHSRQQESTEFYGAGMVSSSYGRSKSQKERPRHRHKEKGSEFGVGVVGAEPKPTEMKADYDNSNFDQYNIRSKYKFDSSFHF